MYKYHIKSLCPFFDFLSGIFRGSQKEARGSRLAARGSRLAARGSGSQARKIASPIKQDRNCGQLFRPCWTKQLFRETLSPVAPRNTSRGNACFGEQVSSKYGT